MRKAFFLLLAFVLLVSLPAALLAGCADPGSHGAAGAPETGNKRDETQAAIVPPADWKVALITDFGDVDDQAYNQAVYEAAKAWCEAGGVPFTCYKPTGDSTAERVEKIKQAAEEGNTVLLLPGYAFAGAITETVETYPDVKLIALDVTEYDLQDAKGSADDFSWEYPANLYFSTYREEQAGYLAGYAAVKLGYKKLGFLGGLAVPAVVRYGYGFVQGVNDAAKELGNQAEVEIKYAYKNCYCTEDIQPWLAARYQEGTEVVFVCGGNLWTYAAQAGAEYNGKIIGCDYDLAPSADAEYGAGLTLTSAMKNLGVTVRTQLDRIASGSFEGGRTENLGIVSETPAENYVGLPASTQWAEGKFTEADYNALVAALYRGEITVSDAIDAEPAVEIAFDYQSNIK